MQLRPVYFYPIPFCLWTEVIIIHVLFRQWYCSDLFGSWLFFSNRYYVILLALLHWVLESFLLWDVPRARHTICIIDVSIRTDTPNCLFFEFWLVADLWIYLHVLQEEYHMIMGLSYTYLWAECFRFKTKQGAYCLRESIH